MTLHPVVDAVTGCVRRGSMPLRAKYLRHVPVHYEFVFANEARQ